MKAAIFREFGGNIQVEEVADPTCPADGVIVTVEANGVCRSDWHGWMGHDPDIRLPHVPGHEMSGVVTEVGTDCRSWRIGDRVCVPFILACGRCGECRAGQQQVCVDQRQPGFTQWGAFAQYVAVPRADTNLVELPEEMGFVGAASLGCRFATAFRAVMEQGRLAAGEWLAVHACGGVGLSAVAIASAAGANVIAVDVDGEALGIARQLGAYATIDARDVADVPEAVMEISGGGVHVSLDALGHAALCRNSILSLRRQGRHVQVGLLEGEHADPKISMGRVLGWELELRGSHGMAAHRYPQMFELIRSGRLDPSKLVDRTVSLGEGTEALVKMGEEARTGVTVITDFTR